MHSEVHYQVAHILVSIALHLVVHTWPGSMKTSTNMTVEFCFFAIKEDHPVLVAECDL